MDDLVVATFAELDAATLYALLRLRSEVFVVEQECPYLDPDGRDTEPTTVHLWLPAHDSAEPTGYLRILAEADGAARIGRVCVAAKARGSGVAGRLLAAALEVIGERPAILDAQSHLVKLYGRYGFVASGADFVEDGIPHTPMARPAPPVS